MRKDYWKVKADCRGLSANEIADKILSVRGITDVNDFLYPSEIHILPASELKNIESASNLFIDGILSNKKFLIYADVDVDGCTSAAIIYHYLKHFDLDIVTHINNGKDHGIQSDFEPSDDIDIIIVVDSINNEVAPYLRLLESGKKLIVLDHHVPTDDVLNIQKDINLVSSANDYANPYLSGSGVCWKFVSYVDSILNTNYAEELCDLAATGIIADVSDVGINSMENRAICNKGFRYINNVGLRTLAGKDELDALTIGFTVGPMINAANRMNCNEIALQLFLTDTQSEAKQYHKQLKKTKELQKELVTKQFVNIEEEAALQKDYKVMFFFVDKNENLSGLLATKASSKWNRPCIVLNTNDPENYSGSMRATDNIDLRQLINDSQLADCQGHPCSAGITIPRNNLKSLSDYLENKLESHKDTHLEIDVRLDQGQITSFLMHKLSSINRITGVGFNPVTVLIEDIKRYVVKQLSGGKHLCVNSGQMNYIQWNFDAWDSIIEEATFSAVGHLEESFFAGKYSTQLLLEDYVFSTTPQSVVLW